MSNIDIFFFPDGRLDPENASKYLGFSKKTLAIWRSNGTGPKFIKPSGKVFYHQSDLDEWLASYQKVTSTAQAEITL